MKRAKMLEIMVISMWKTTNERSLLKLYTQADTLLADMESAGMIPPAYVVESWKSYLNGNLLVSKSYELEGLPKWEPETDQDYINSFKELYKQWRNQ